MAARQRDNNKKTLKIASSVILLGAAIFLLARYLMQPSVGEAVNSTATPTQPEEQYKGTSREAPRSGK